MKGKAKRFLKNHSFEFIFFALLFLFSWWLMWHTFDYRDNTIYIATKAWSDFAANIPLIRSFSWGGNFPPEYPLFPGEPIRYHFLFYFLVGTLERLGLPLDWALNLPSIIGFFSLMVLIYLLGKLIFNRLVGVLATIFFLSNSSFSFIEFFRQHPFSSKTIQEITHNQIFPSFGPYDQKVISAFWNLNIYTNQRHLAGAYAIALFFVYLLIRSAKSKKPFRPWQILVLGVVLGLFPFYHKAVFLMIGVILGWLFFSFPKLRQPIFFISFIAAVLALPQILPQLGAAKSSFTFNPGYLLTKPLKINHLFSYWTLNLGLSIFLIPLGFLLSKKTAKKILFAFFLLFLIGNLFQFSPEIAANHKFFNLFIITGNMFSAWVIYLLWKKKLFGKLLAPTLVFLLIFSGIIDFFPIKNDPMGAIADAPKNPDVLWIRENTPPDAIFLNSSYIYHPASLAGRKIFLGWPYFPWSAGYDTDKRGSRQEKVLGASAISKDGICRFLIQNQIQFVSIGTQDRDLPINHFFWQNNFKPIYKNLQKGLTIFSVSQNCPTLSK